MEILKKKRLFTALILLIFSISMSGCFESKLKFLKEFGVEGKSVGEFNGPTDIAVTSKGDVVICDTGNNRVVVYSSEFEYIRTLAAMSGMNAPYGVGVDTADNIYVADTNNNRILKFDAGGRFLLEITSTVKFGQQKDPANALKRPYDVGVLGDNRIFVVDTYNRILIFESTGICTQKLGTKGTGSNSFDIPTRVAISQLSQNEKNYYVYVADSFNSRITKFNSEFRVIYEIKDKGMLDFLRDPRGLAVMPDKSIIVTDCGAKPVCAYSSQGVFEGSGGSFGAGRGKIMSPAGIGIDLSRKRAYVSDQLQHKIVVFSLHKDNFAGTSNE